MREPKAPEVVRHVSLDIVNNAIKSAQLGDQDLALVKDSLLSYIRNVYGTAGDSNLQLDPLPIQNKITQTMTNLFTALYASQWTSFFHDILALTTTGGTTGKDHGPGVTLYLRILISVHDEIADILLPRSPEEQKKDNELKDLVRQRDTVMIASSWHEILAYWKLKDDTIVRLCLTTIGRWVSWTDIALAVNDPFLHLLFEYLDPRQISVGKDEIGGRKEAALEAFIDILAKKMSPGDKLELIEVLKIHEAVTQLAESPELSEMRSTANYDTDLAENVAKLVNNTVSDIVKALDGAQENDPVSQRGTSLLKSFMQHIIRFLSDEYDEICSTVIPCLTDILTLLRKKVKFSSILGSEILPTLPFILDVIIAKLKYDETSFWGHDDTQTDEAEFQELRKRLHNLQKALATVDEDMYVEKIRSLVVSIFDKFQNQNGQIDWRELELALHEMELFGELAFKHGGLYSKTKPVTPAAEQLIGMMVKLVQTGIFRLYANVDRPLTAIRYCFLFTSCRPTSIYGDL